MEKVLSQMMRISVIGKNFFTIEGKRTNNDMEKWPTETAHWKISENNYWSYEKKAQHSTQENWN